MAEALPLMQTMQDAVDSTCSIGPSRQLTREELEKTHKSELQKQCRELGLSKVWVKKDQLIEMILQNPHLTKPQPPASQTQQPDTTHSPCADTAPKLCPHAPPTPPGDMENAHALQSNASKPQILDVAQPVVHHHDAEQPLHPDPDTARSPGSDAAHSVHRDAEHPLHL